MSSKFKAFLIGLSVFLLASTAYAVTILPVSQGGTGWGNPGGFTAGVIPFGNGLSPFATSSAFTFNNAGSRLTVTNATTTNLSAVLLWLPGQSAGCAQFDSSAKLTSTGVNCGTGGGGADPFTHPTPAQSATTTGFEIMASSTIGDGTTAGGLTISGGATTTGTFIASNNQFNINSSGVISKIGNGAVNISSAALQLSSVGGSVLLQNNVSTNVNSFLDLNAGTGFQANQGVRIFRGSVGSGLELFRVNNLGNIGVGSSTPWAQFSIAATSTQTTPVMAVSTSTATATSTAFFIDNNGLVGINKVPTVQLDVQGTASTTNFFGAMLVTCNGSQFLQWTAGQFGCGTPAGGASAGDPFTHTSVYGQITSATSTLIALTGSPFSLVASSTAEFVYSSTTAATFFSNLYVPYIAPYQILETDGNRNIIATTSIGYNLLTGTPAIPTGANPTGSIGATSATNGVATTFLRSDAGIPCTTATASTPGCLAAADFATFNGKLNFSNLFNQDSNFGLAVISTTTIPWWKNGLQASSTSQLDQASSTEITTGTLWNTGITSALALFDGNHKETAYGGASACSANNFVTTLSAVGGTTCGTAAISGVNLGSNLNSLSVSGDFSGTAYNGSAAVSNWALVMSTGHTWTATQNTSASATTTNAGGYFASLIAAPYFDSTSTVASSYFNNSIFISSSTAPQIFLSDGTATNNYWSLRTGGTNFYFSTSTGAVNGTSSPAFLTLASNFGVGIASSSPQASGLTIGWGNLIMTGGQIAMAYASSTGALASVSRVIDWNSSGSHRLDATTTTTLQVNATSSHPMDGGKYVLKVCQDSTGGRTVSFDNFTSGYLFFSMGTPTPSTIANSGFMYGMIYDKHIKNGAGGYDVVAATSTPAGSCP